MRRILGVCVLLLSMPAGAGFFKCIDAKGKTYFSDRACTTKASEPLKSGDDVPKLSMEQAKVKGGSMSMVGDNEATKRRLAKENPELYRRLEKKAGQSLSGCRVRGDGVVMSADC